MIKRREEDITGNGVDQGGKVVKRDVYSMNDEWINLAALRPLGQHPEAQTEEEGWGLSLRP